MSVNEFVSLNTAKDPELRMTAQLAVHCAPILKDAKAANILTVAEADFKGIGYLLQGTGISYRFLKTAGGKAILYLYRKKRLQDILRDSRIREFLAQYGYQAAMKEKNVEAVLDVLSAHVRLFQNGKSAFPHEIGIFLGYPLWDVRGFLENEGKNFAYLGYWKVYRDVQNAKLLFQRFDAIREQALEELGRGMTLREIAV
ncbi:MAG: DUF3793 family protein [Lachnospiraceae bacterium]|nr:DUF3793 family protein [Lachnospiraceae bacterium]MBQ8116455.1 DUF3793 family protein [Lachnospiraceae bacterium]